MSEWNENANGNYVYRISADDIMTVFKKKTGDGWSGVHDGEFLKSSYDTPEEAQKAMEEFVFEFNSKLAAPISQNIGWRESKKGGYYMITEGGIRSVKRASSGKWYVVTASQGMLEGHWFDTAKEAMTKAVQL
jgi:hypothetical protein